VDTSNPFVVRDIPTAEESFVVIRFTMPEAINFPYLLAVIEDSFQSRPDTLVIPGAKLDYALQFLVTPLVKDLVAEGRKLRAATPAPA
jgi:phosphoribulokinase